MTGAAAPDSIIVGETNPTVCYAGMVKATAYFTAIRGRPDRAVIRDEWIMRAIRSPVREHNAFFDRRFVP
jgi:hypothetical protein